MGGIGRPSQSERTGGRPTDAVEAIRRQYQAADLPVPGRCAELGRPDARTVTTGHQLCLATGPAFTWYKVMTAVALARALEARWDTPVIPVFWMAAEDHDFEEVASLWTGRGWHRWAPNAEAEIGGAVGRMHTDNAAGIHSGVGC